MNKEHFTFYTYKDLGKRLNLEDYFKHDVSHLLSYLKRFKNWQIAAYEGDLIIDSIEDLEMMNQLGILIVKGNMYVRKKLDGLSFQECIGGLAVTQDLKCESLVLSGGSLSIGNDLIIDKYLFSELPNECNSFILVENQVITPFIFRGDADRVQFEFKDETILNNPLVTKTVYYSNKETTLKIETGINEFEVMTVSEYSKYLDLKTSTN